MSNILFNLVMKFSLVNTFEFTWYLNTTFCFAFSLDVIFLQLFISPWNIDSHMARHGISAVEASQLDSCTRKEASHAMTQLSNVHWNGNRTGANKVFLVSCRMPSARMLSTDAVIKQPKWFPLFGAQQSLSVLSPLWALRRIPSAPLCRPRLRGYPFTASICLIAASDKDSQCSQNTSEWPTMRNNGRLNICVIEVIPPTCVDGTWQMKGRSYIKQIVKHVDEAKTTSGICPVILMRRYLFKRKCRTVVHYFSVGQSFDYT